MPTFRLHTQKSRFLAPKLAYPGILVQVYYAKRYSMNYLELYQITRRILKKGQNTPIIQFMSRYFDQIFSCRSPTEGRRPKAKRTRYEPSINQSPCRPSFIRPLIYDFLSTHLGSNSLLKLDLIGFVFLLAENTFIFIFP